MKLTESQLRNIITKTIKESVFGYNGNDLQGMGLKNPADDYNVNYQEAVQKCNEILPILQNFHDYIYGVEEDAKNGIEEKPGVYFNMNMRSMWNDDEDEKYYADELRNMCYDLDRTISTIKDFIEFAENK